MIIQQLEAFTATPADRLPQEFRDLVDTLRDDGTATAVTHLTDALPTAPGYRQPHLAITLGLLADSGDAEVRTALRDRLAEYLALVRDAGQPLLRALVYLLGHFPEDRARVLAAFEDAPLSADELTRLDRALATFDPDAPMIGTVWPSPSAWSLTEEETAEHLAWTRSLPTELAAGAWRKDTETLHAYAGAKALWTAEYGLGPDREDPEVVTPSPPRTEASAWTRFASAVRCPACRWPLADDATCTGCGTPYTVVDGYLDLAATTGPTSRPTLTRYERTLRPAVLRLSGSNWDDVVTPAAEDAYLADHVRPAAGPVVDLGCGPGRFTAVLAAEFGQDRVIALDSAPLMLTMLEKSLPDVTRIRGDALNLPFANASLGAVNCWNTLQALPDPAQALAEVGRCLRPGGTLTLLTFRTSHDPVYAHFQRQLTVRTFAMDELQTWLTTAGLTVTDQSSPGSFLLLTATRPDSH